MLTSTLVKPPVFDLPESNSKTVAPTDIVVGLGEDGTYFVNGEKTKLSSVRRLVQKALGHPNRSLWLDLLVESQRRERLLDPMESDEI